MHLGRPRRNRPGDDAGITRELWPTPDLVMDGASIAADIHLELDQPILIEYV